VGEAILIRAVEPIEGIETMRRNRRMRGKGGRGAGEQPNLTNGPAKFCEAFAIAREQNGTDLLGDEIYLLEGEKATAYRIGRSARIGVKNGREKKWRFYLKENLWISS
jgi:DNA-3-methyladenine glycosylase